MAGASRCGIILPNITEETRKGQKLSMKVLVQDVSRKLYLGREKDLWVKAENEARDFSSSINAIDFCIQNRISGVEIVLSFADPRFNIRLDAFAQSR